MKCGVGSGVVGQGRGVGSESQGCDCALSLLAPSRPTPLPHFPISAHRESPAAPCTILPHFVPPHPTPPYPVIARRYSVAHNWLNNEAQRKEMLTIPVLPPVKVQTTPYGC